jgi:hypothetical protein
VNRVTVGVAVVALFAGLMAGGVTVYTLQPTKTPTACVDMGERATALLGITGELVEAITDRANAVDWEQRSIHGAEARHLTETIEAEAPKYEQDYNECMEAAQ